MGWQDVGVLVVVASAAVFLIRRFGAPSRPRSRPQETFIPLEQVKRRNDGLPN
jgi:hypothetical protein